MSYIVNDGVRINYEVEGLQGKKCIVLVHGFFGSLEDWYECDYVNMLQEDYCLILVDARGHGKSDKPTDPKKYEHRVRAQDIIMILDKEGIGRANYIGYSMGGWIGIGLIKWFEDRFDSVIINSAHPFSVDMSDLAEATKTLDEWVNETDMPEKRKARFLSKDRAALLAAVADDRIDNSDILRKMKTRCLLMYGEKDEMKEKMIRAAQLQRTIEFFEIPGVDHSGALGASACVTNEMKRFFGR